ncbi:MAG: AMP-binding protein [Pseudomonadota bacterium]
MKTLNNNSIPVSRTLPTLLDEMANRFPNRQFLTDYQRSWTYASFRHDVRTTAKGLHGLGVRPGDKVGILMGNQAEWLLTAFAVVTLGAVAVPVNTWWRARELQHALELAEVSTLIMADRYLTNDYTAELRQLGQLAQALPALCRIICLGTDLPPGAIPYSAIGEKSALVGDELIDAAQAGVSPDDIAYILFTSGSTARAKAAPMIHKGLIENPFAIGERMHLSEEDRTLVTVSLFWSFGCVNALLATMTHGGSLVLQFSFDPVGAMQLIERERCSVLYLTSNMALALQQHPERRKFDLRSLRTGTGNPVTARILYDIGVHEICPAYGMTEGYANTTTSDGKLPIDVRLRNSGYPLPNMEIEIVDLESRAPLLPGDVGEIRMKGYVTPCYYRDAQRTSDAFDAAGWFYTGDLGVFDSDGGLQIRGRCKEMIKTSGINVAPADVEEILMTCPGVHQAVVVGVPDPDRIEAIAALVVLQPDAALTSDAVLAHCRRAAAAYKVPRMVQFVTEDQVPLTATGKIDKKEVQRMLAERYAG